ncbi:hypothetical protein M408DRAFT_123202 [Serendipita vermifera MAFF 305830]|uniref:Uncharacterized protein n=1 Tax=Serendipita vermifera MAFF 305830 TaxID=933852 RepID=A0A0C2WTF2_SERVB|nr:hypothetical protein M408DRAFT_123202 [Serendipita vermifera MAFF 305830]
MDNPIPPILIFNSNTSITNLRPGDSLVLPGSTSRPQKVKYVLSAILLYKNSHFTAAISYENCWWFYDGMFPNLTNLHNSPMPPGDSIDSNSLSLNTLEAEGYMPTHFVYMRITRPY